MVIKLGHGQSVDVNVPHHGSGRVRIVDAKGHAIAEISVVSTTHTRDGKGCFRYRTDSVLVRSFTADVIVNDDDGRNQQCHSGYQVED